jgi:hypothetical protein
MSFPPHNEIMSDPPRHSLRQRGLPVLINNGPSPNEGTTNDAFLLPAVGAPVNTGAAATSNIEDANINVAVSATSNIEDAMDDAAAVASSNHDEVNIAAVTEAHAGNDEATTASTNNAAPPIISKNDAAPTASTNDAAPTNISDQAGANNFLVGIRYPPALHGY